MNWSIITKTTLTIRITTMTTSMESLPTTNGRRVAKAKERRRRKRSLRKRNPRRMRMKTKTKKRHKKIENRAKKKAKNRSESSRSRKIRTLRRRPRRKRTPEGRPPMLGERQMKRDERDQLRGNARRRDLESDLSLKSSQSQRPTQNPRLTLGKRVTSTLISVMEIERQNTKDTVLVVIFVLNQRSCSHGRPIRTQFSMAVLIHSLRKTSLISMGNLPSTLPIHSV